MNKKIRGKVDLKGTAKKKGDPVYHHIGVYLIGRRGEGKKIPGLFEKEQGAESSTPHKETGSRLSSLVRGRRE